MNKTIHTYIDLDVVNNNYSHQAENPILKFQETRNIPYLNGDSSDYFASIVRFSLMTSNTLPVFIPVTETGINQNNVNKTIYKITFEVIYGVAKYDATASVIHNPTDTTIKLPSRPLINQDLSSEYYCYRNYRSFADDINLALGECFERLMSTLNVNNITMYNAFITSHCPFIDFFWGILRPVNLFYQLINCGVMEYLQHLAHLCILIYILIPH